MVALWAGPLWSEYPFHRIGENPRKSTAKDRWTEANGSRGPCNKFSTGSGNGLHSSGVRLDGSFAYVLRFLYTFTAQEQDQFPSGLEGGLERLLTFYNSQSAWGLQTEKMVSCRWVFPAGMGCVHCNKTDFIVYDLHTAN